MGGDCYMRETEANRKASEALSQDRARDMAPTYLHGGVGLGLRRGMFVLFRVLVLGAVLCAVILAWLASR